MSMKKNQEKDKNTDTKDDERTEFFKREQK